MTRRLPRRPLAATALLLGLASASSSSSRAFADEPGSPLPDSLAKSLTFAATFDKSLDADVARGDARVYSGTLSNRKQAVLGLGDAGVARIAEGGRSGGALKFEKGNKRAVFYKVRDNVPYRASGGWSGTFSYFLSLDPEKDLPPEYVDPLQVTERAWNDAAFWNDFTKDDRPRKFRLGVLADLKVWNPDNKDFDKLPDEEKPAVVVNTPPFASGRWTHVVVTFDRFNTGKADSEARLYLDGALQGGVRGKTQTYTWDPDKAVIFLGLGYAGLMDDVMVFDRTLNASEVQTLTRLASGRKPLLPR